MTFFKYFSALVVVVGLSLGPGIGPAQAETVAERNKRIQNIFNEYRAMQLAIMVHKKCETLDILTLKAAEITSDLRTRALLDMRAIEQPQLNTTHAAIQKEVDGANCGIIKGNANLKIANDRAIFYKDFYLYVWHEYMEVAALRTIMSSEALNGSADKYSCGKHSFDQIRAIKPHSDTAHQAMKTKGQFKNARAQAEEMIKNCQAKRPGVTNSPLMQMLEVAQAELAKGD